MNVQLIEEPLCFRLVGKGSPVEGCRYGEVGMKLMNEVWPVVKASQLATTGINHWVYLDDGSMFVGVELLPATQADGQLESLDFELSRYLRHVHVGPYQALPAKWQQLKDELAQRGEKIKNPSLEVYGHHGDDPEKLETTILIGLAAKPNASS